MKKILIYIVSIIILAGIIFFGWFLLFKEKTGEDGTFGTGLLPFGRGSDNIPSENPALDNIGEPFEDGREIPLLGITQITNRPVSGFYVGDGKMLFVDRATGHVFETTYSESGFSTKKITNTTIPGIEEAFWVEGGGAVILRYTQENSSLIQSYYLKLEQTPLQTENGSDFVQTSGSFLAPDIDTLSVSPTGNRIFYLEKTSSGSVGTVSQPNGQGKRVVFNSPIKEWQAEWWSDNLILLTTKASGISSGVSYTLNLSNNTLARQVSGLGLTSKTDSVGKNVFYGLGGSLPTLYLGSLNQKIGEREIFQTLPEKCLWSKKNVGDFYCAVPKTLPVGTYPDDWYQGILTFDDEIVAIKNDRTEGFVLWDEKLSFDYIKLAIDPEDKYLFFINKKDLSLWVVPFLD